MKSFKDAVSAHSQAIAVLSCFMALIGSVLTVSSKIVEHETNMQRQLHEMENKFHKDLSNIQKELDYLKGQFEMYMRMREEGR